MVLEIEPRALELFANHGTIPLAHQKFQAILTSLQDRNEIGPSRSWEYNKLRQKGTGLDSLLPYSKNCREQYSRGEFGKKEL